MKSPLPVLIILFLLTALLSSCEKGATITPLVSTSPLTGGGTTTPPTSTTDYQPLTTGTTWRYQNTQDGKMDTSTITITGKTKVVDSKTFFEITEKTGSVIDTSYFYKGNNIYISNTQNYAEGIGTAFIYLNDKEDVGYTWSGQAIANNPLSSGTYTGKILGKNISKIILGKVYTNVIHTQVVITLTVLDTPGTLTSDIYTAKGVGIVQADISDGTDVKTSKMIDYSVK